MKNTNITYSLMMCAQYNPMVVCTSHYLIIIIVQIYLSVLNF